jgi:uncharacterized SAM-binding protein YcdF (DUF218 family)
METGSTSELADFGSSARAPGDPAGERSGLDKNGRGWIVHAAVLIFSAMLFSAGVFWGGFMTYAAGVSAMKPATHALDADGIVVFTGGAERVAGALELLSGGHAQRLLISGVHPETSARQISRVVDTVPSIFDCCVDLDRRAVNTVGNASETAKWVRQNAFGSLIVVTSAYHMPRSLAELGSAMPEVTLLPYPVTPATLDLQRWYSSTGTISLLLEEYLKYTATKARLIVDGSGAASLLLADLAP